MLDDTDFPLTAYGCAIFSAASPAPIVVMATAAMAADIVRRLNEGEIAAQICDAVAAEAPDHDGHGYAAASECARLIRGRIAARDAETMAAARAPEPEAPAEAWGAR